MSSEISHREFQELRRRTDELSEKFDGMSESLTDIKMILSKQDGLSLPSRIRDLELRVQKAEKWQFVVTGGLIVLQLLFAVVGKIIVDKVLN